MRETEVLIEGWSSDSWLYTPWLLSLSYQNGFQISCTRLLTWWTFFLVIRLILQSLVFFLTSIAIIYYLNFYHFSNKLAFSSKSPQIFLNYKNKSTGQLSVITQFLLFGGSIARLFTIIVEVDNLLIFVMILKTFFFIEI